MTDRSESTLYSFLAHIPYFEGLDSDIIRAVADTVYRHSYDTDAWVLLKEEPCPGLGIVESGTLKGVRLAPNGREQILKVFHPGHVFGTVAVFSDAPNPISVVALEPASVCFVDQASLWRLMTRFPTLMRSVVRQLAARTHELVELVDDLSLRTVEMRLARRLLEEAEGGVIERDRWATQSEMAARLGTVVYVLNRALRGLEEDRLISVTRGAITILDPAGLRERILPQ
jgi:CRP/FNR family transcriptional regulator